MASITWANDVSGAFETATNWSGGVVPGPSDIAVIQATGLPFTVTTTSAVTVQGIQTSANATLALVYSSSNVTFAATEGSGGGENAGHILIGGNDTLAIGGVFTNSGTIALQDSNGRGNVALYDTGSGVTLTGGGDLLLSPPGMGEAGVVDSIRILPNSTMVNFDNAISGTGAVYIGEGGSLDNEAGGVVDANLSGSGQDLTISGVSAYAGIINAGVLEATGSGATLFMKGVTLDNSSSGVVLAGTGSAVVVDGDLVGGTLKSSGTGYISVSGELDGSTVAITNDGSIRGSGVKIVGSIDNAGSLDLYGGVHVLAQGLTLSGGGLETIGTVLADSGPTNLVNVDTTLALQAVLGGLRLVNEAAGTVISPGLSGTSGATFDNAGEVTIYGATTHWTDITLDQSAGGTVQVASGARLDLLSDDLIGGSSTISGQVFTSHTTLSGAFDVSKQVFVGYGGSAVDYVGQGGFTVSGGGQVIMRGGGILEGLSSADTLLNTGAVIVASGSSADQLGSGHMGLVNQAAGVIRTDNASITIDTGPATFINAGLVAASGGDVTIAGALTNTGRLSVTGDHDLMLLQGSVTGAGTATIFSGTLSAAGAFSENVTFGTSGKLVLADSQAYGGTITGFSHTGTTSLDLSDLDFVSGTTKASYSGTTASGVLTVTDGLHTSTIHLLGNYTKAIFTVSNDGSGGALVVDPMARAAANLIHAISALATVRTAGRSPPPEYATQTLLPVSICHAAPHAP